MELICTSVLCHLARTTAIPGMGRTKHICSLRLLWSTSGFSTCHDAKHATERERGIAKLLGLTLPQLLGLTFPPSFGKS